MVEIFDNVLTAEEIKTLLDFYYRQDNLVDDRLDVCSKNPAWDSDNWPQATVKRVLDQVLSEPYRVEVSLFFGSRISFRLHTDSGDGDGQRPYKNVLIPLHIEGPASTVIFDNYWNGPHMRFGRVQESPWLYRLPNRSGQMQLIPDVRNLLDQCNRSPESVVDFTVDLAFVQALEHIVAVRSENAGKPPDGYVTDYSDIVNYTPNSQFDLDLHEKYLQHIPIENLHGLTIDRVVPWQLGQVITFDRTQLHAAGSGHEFKIGISIFTYHY